ncbi:protein spindle-F isoform X2 [Pseudomyrmex gracilis]|uniref:protein spindle-F isoform X2 n=1 Tax=Pseudomyrmex gracilis TaxID=219809 RepID=UPI000994C9DB|nr:protein spindle-F isoform X2 [Pseudomyrmex gracilis]
MDVDNSQDDIFESNYALVAAFKTMKERCQQLQTRLAAVEEENKCLRLECNKSMAMAVVNDNSGDRNDLKLLHEKVEELTKQKSQLTHRIIMVATENRQLWNRLTRLIKTNKSLDEKELGSLEEISLRLMNSIMLEKCDLEQQYAEMVELHKNSELNLQNIGFTYPEDHDTSSLEQLKEHENRLSQTKDALLGQQIRLKKILQNVKVLKGTTCSNCRKNTSKAMCQTGTQFDSDDSFKEHEAIQTSLMTPSLSIEKPCNLNDDMDVGLTTCPLCGITRSSISVEDYHEHVLNHFLKDGSIKDFELMN